MTISNLKWQCAITFTVLCATLELTGCAGFTMSPESACDPQGNCAPGVEWDLDICSVFPPVFVPPGQPCPTEPIEFPDPEDPEEGDVTPSVLVNMLMSISAPNGITYTSSSGTVTATIFSSSGSISTITPWALSGGKVGFADPAGFEHWLNTNITGSAHTLRLKVEDLSFSAFGSSAGTVPITVALEKDGHVFGEATESYEYDPPPAPPDIPSVVNIFLGCHQPGCALWRFSYSAKLAAHYRIEYQSVSGGNWNSHAVTASTTHLPHLASNPLYFRIRGENGAGAGDWFTFYVPGQCGGRGGGLQN